MADYFLAGLAAFGFVFLKAWQQRNVAWYSLKWILPTSYLIASFEVFIVWRIAETGWHPLLVFLIGTGAGLGALAATYIHERFISGKARKNS